MSRHVELTTRELAGILKTATFGVKGSQRAVVRIEMDGETLVAAGPGAQGSAPANGSWSGPALVNAISLKLLASRLPPNATITVRAAEGFIWFGPTRLPAELLGIAPPVVVTTLGAGSKEILIALYRAGKPTVTATFGQRALEKAEEDAERAIGQAVAALRHFGVDRQDIAEALRRAITRQVGEIG